MSAALVHWLGENQDIASEKDKLYIQNLSLHRGTCISACPQTVDNCYLKVVALG